MGKFLILHIIKFLRSFAHFENGQPSQILHNLVSPSIKMGKFLILPIRKFLRSFAHFRNRQKPAGWVVVLAVVLISLVVVVVVSLVVAVVVLVSSFLSGIMCDIHVL